MASARAMPCVKGNCDGDITLADKPAYNLARSDPEEYASQYPTCDILNGDVNGDDVLDEDDDDLFKALLSGGNSAMYVVYTWDAENRLIKVEPGGTPQNGQYKAEYKYDRQGRRIEKQVWTYSGGWTQTEHWKFMYVDWLLLLELDGLDSDSVKRQYTWGRDLSSLMRNPVGHVSNLSPALTGAGGIAGLLSVHDDALSVSYVYFADVQGNIGQVVDLAAASASVSMMAKYEYDVYGNRTVTGGTYAQPFAFSTKPYDAESGFSYFGYRYYSPVLGRWITRDPIEETGGLLLYGFLKNGPGVRYDPDGRMAETIAGGLILADPPVGVIVVTVVVAIVLIDWWLGPDDTDDSYDRPVPPPGRITVSCHVHFMGEDTWVPAGCPSGVSCDACCRQLEGGGLKYLGACYLWAPI